MEMDSLLPKSTITINEALRTVSGTQFSAQLALLTGLTQLADAMELLLLSFLASEIRCPFQLNQYDVTLLQTCVLIGMWIGSNATGIFSDSFGRKPAVIISLVCTVFGGLASTFALNFKTIVTARFVVGLGVGSAPVALTLFTEFLPSKQEEETRGRTLIMFFSFFSIGALFEALVAWATLSTRWRWRALLLASVSPSILLLIVSPFYLVESPRWLVTKGRLQEALDILRYVGQINNRGHLPSGIELIEDDEDDDEDGKGDVGGNGEDGNTSLLKSLIDDKNLEDKEEKEEDVRRVGVISNTTTTTVALSVLFFLMASLYYSIVLVGSAIVETKSINGTIRCSFKNGTNSTNIPPTHSTVEFLSLVVTNGAELPGLFVAYILLDRIGRKKTIQVFFASCGIFCIALWVTTLSSKTSPLWLKTLIVFGARGTALGFNQSLWIYTALFYPTNVRTRGIGFTTSMARIGALVAPIVVNQGSLQIVAGVCVGLAFFSLLVTTKFLPRV